jgi:hypothetical protein
MTRVKRQDLSKLSSQEAKIVGNPDDYDWDNATLHPARVRPTTTQFSLRVEPSLLERLQDLAAAKSSTVSDVAREALERYVESGGRPAISNVLVSFPRDAGMLLQVRGGQAIVSPNRVDAPVGEQTQALEPRAVTY